MFVLSADPSYALKGKRKTMRVNRSISKSVNMNVKYATKNIKTILKKTVSNLLNCQQQRNELDETSRHRGDV